MKKILIVVALMVFGSTLFSQIQTVQLNSKKMLFNEGGELPAEKAFIITTDASKSISMIKMQVFSGINFSKKPLNESEWRRNSDINSSVVILPNHYKLRGGREYSFRFLYYRNINEAERSQIREILNGTANALIRTNIQPDEDRYKLLSSPSDIYRSLNEIVEEGMVNYETKSGIKVNSFSSIIENMLRAIAKTKIAVDTVGNKNSDQIDLLMAQLQNEIGMIASNYQYIREDEVAIKDYPVEKISNTLALNLGYGGIFKSGDINNINNVDYFSGPYAGVSFPLGSRAFSSTFWKNASLSAGIFLKNFKVSDSVNVSGPVVEKPIYAAFGYRFFDFLKLHAGAAILEEKTRGGISKSSVYVKPFVGLSIELNLWLGFGKK